MGYPLFTHSLTSVKFSEQYFASIFDKYHSKMPRFNKNDLTGSPSNMIWLLVLWLSLSYLSSCHLFCLSILFIDLDLICCTYSGFPVGPHHLLCGVHYEKHSLEEERERSWCDAYLAHVWSGFKPTTPKDHVSPKGKIPECQARSKPRVLPDVPPSHQKKEKKRRNAFFIIEFYAWRRPGSRFTWCMFCSVLRPLSA